MTDYDDMRSENNATDMITLYVASGTNKIDIINKLTSEQSTCRNIKDRATRSSVTNSLKSCL